MHTMDWAQSLYKTHAGDPPRSTEEWRKKKWRALVYSSECIFKQIRVHSRHSDVGQTERRTPLAHIFMHVSAHTVALTIHLILSFPFCPSLLLVLLTYWFGFVSHPLSRRTHTQRSLAHSHANCILFAYFYWNKSIHIDYQKIWQLTKIDFIDGLILKIVMASMLSLISAVVLRTHTKT